MPLGAMVNTTSPSGTENCYLEPIFSTRCTLLLPVLVMPNNRKWMARFTKTRWQNYICYLIHYKWLQESGSEWLVRSSSSISSGSKLYTAVQPIFGKRTKALVVDICWSSPTLVGRVACPVVDHLSWASRYQILQRSWLFSFSLAWSSRLCVSITDSWKSCLTFIRQLMEASKEHSHARRNWLVEASSQTGPIGLWEWSLLASSAGRMGFEGWPVLQGGYSAMPPDHQIVPPQAAIWQQSRLQWLLELVWFAVTLLCWVVLLDTRLSGLSPGVQVKRRLARVQRQSQ